MNRRDLFRSVPLAAVPAMARTSAAAPAAQPKFKISLAEWSLHKAIGSRMISNLEFPRIAREQFGIEGLEFVNGLWAPPTQGYIQRLKNNMKSTGTKGVLLMCDDEGFMGHSDRTARRKAAENHFKWVDVAAELGCHSIRTNMYPDDKPATPDQISAFLERCSESFTHLCNFAKPRNVNVLIENHGGLSSRPEIVIRLMKMVNLPNFGVLPDFGNFYEVDRYEGVKELMPYAKGVSFKCYDFGPNGKETKIDMDQMMKIVAEAGYQGYVGIEYEGSRVSEWEGVVAAKRYLDGLLAA